MTDLINNPPHYTATEIEPIDVVEHPPHYTSHPSGVECISITEHFDFVIGNIVKYAWRAGLKDGNSRLQDLQKCLWYAQRAVDREMRNDATDRLNREQVRTTDGGVPER